MRHMVSFGALAVVAASVTGCGSSPAAHESNSPSQSVQAPVTTVREQLISVPYEAVGTVRAKMTTTIQSKIMGHVLAVNVREGDRVEAGQVLVEVDSREVDAQVQRAESALREAREMRQDTEKMTQAAVHSQTAADAGNDLAAAAFRRYKALAEKQAVSRQVYDEAEARSKGAAADAARAAEMVLSARAKLGEADARVQQAEAGLSNAETLRSFAKVTAPFAGIVTRKTVEVGDLAAPGSPLLILEDGQHYRLEAQVDEEQVHRIALGAAAEILLDGPQTAELAGRVAEIAPTSDPSSRTFVVKIDLPQSAPVWSGMFGRARFVTGENHVLTVPASAVFQRGQLTGVYALDENGVARLRLITTGKRFGSDVEVLSGLQAGETIVADNTGAVVDGAAVQHN
ncbi:MAG: efflux RND transporter periplasmic adaptor subunit [Candidatus Hydrogenedentes bacterium]|nr:efflux RND transporter periplasmic adaptor subunit [Candidatus Hydrogenedentota bacterium]